MSNLKTKCLRDDGKNPQWFIQAVHTLLCRGDHGVVVLVGCVVVGLHLHTVLCPEHLGVLAVSQEVLVVQLQVPQSQTVLLHPQGLKLQRCG